MRLQPPGTRHQRLLVAAASVLAFSGLFAMHALGTHGAAHGTMSLMTQEPATSAGAAMVVVDGPVPAPMPASSEVTRSGHLGNDVLGLCVAVLGGLLLSVLLRLRYRRPGRAQAVSPRRLPTNSAVGRERDPPCLVRLSVMRC